MKDNNNKNISVSISNDIWKKIKILSIQKEISFSEQVIYLLEKSVNNKKTDNLISEDV